EIIQFHLIPVTFLKEVIDLFAKTHFLQELNLYFIMFPHLSMNNFLDITLTVNLTMLHLIPENIFFKTGED
ncbi:hypothetical protein, partial [Klebsiella pneumoniae]|uniref:hypothetical protein n=1 Tax=Klebsiella pneumoniae TaxID=573 RepID=UPI0040555BD7